MIHLDWKLRCQVGPTSWAPFGMRLSQSWCVRQPFKRLSGIGIANEQVDFWLVSKVGFLLGDLLYYETWPPVRIQLIVDIPPRSKLRYPDFVGSPLQAILAVPTSGSCPKVSPPPSGMCLTPTLREKISVTPSGAWPTNPRRHGHSWHYCKAKGDKKLENKLYGLAVLGIFVVSTLSLLNVIGFQMVSPPSPPSWNLINFLNNNSFPHPKLYYSVPRSITNFSEFLLPWEG